MGVNSVVLPLFFFPIYIYIGEQPVIVENCTNLSLPIKCTWTTTGSFTKCCPLVCHALCQALPQACFAVLYYGSNWFSRVEPPQTNKKLPYDPCHLWTSMVWGCSVALNHPKLMSTFTTGLDPCFVLRFKQVQKSWTTPNSWEIILWRRFGKFEPPQVL